MLRQQPSRSRPKLPIRARSLNALNVIGALHAAPEAADALVEFW